MMSITVWEIFYNPSVTLSELLHTVKLVRLGLYQNTFPITVDFGSRTLHLTHEQLTLDDIFSCLIAFNYPLDLF